jgi:2'-5' RNA ligase
VVVVGRRLSDTRYGVYLRPAPALEAAVARTHALMAERCGVFAAGRLMPHVTLKGFFRTDADAATLQRRVEEALAGREAVALHDAGVTAFATDAIVLDVDGDRAGRRNEPLHALHEAAFAATAPLVARDCDFTPHEHANDAFLAHITLAMADISRERFADVLAYARSLEPMGPTASEATEVQLLAFAGEDWSGSWWTTLTWRPLASVRLRPASRAETDG